MSSPSRWLGDHWGKAPLGGAAALVGIGLWTGLPVLSRWIVKHPSCAEPVFSAQPAGALIAVLSVVAFVVGKGYMTARVARLTKGVEVTQPPRWFRRAMRSDVPRRRPLAAAAGTTARFLSQDGVASSLLFSLFFLLIAE